MLNKTSFPKTDNTLLKKNERIHSRKDIALLFSNKAISITGPIITLKLARIEDVDKSSTSRKIFISVPKKKIKRAVDRNKIKRHIREIYRNNKNLFPIQEGTTILLVGFIYNTKEIYEFNTLKKEIINLCSNYSKCDDINNK